MLLQVNDDLGYERCSLSLVLRGYFIESLIQHGFHNLIFWAGVGGALANYVEFAPGTMIHIDSLHPGWRFVQQAAKYISPALPRNMQRDMGWLTYKQSAASE